MSQPSKKEAVIYLRVSTDQQAESGLGLADQRSKTLKWAQENGYTVVEVIVADGVSTRTSLSKREKLQKALSLITPGRILLVAKRDRLARSLEDSVLIRGAMKKKRGRIISAAGEGTEGDTPADNLMGGMVDLFAEYEREMIKWRVVGALDALLEQGLCFGHPPYGVLKFERDGRAFLGFNPEEIQIIRVAVEFRRAKKGSRSPSWQRVADHLNSLGLYNRNDQPWNRNISRVMKPREAVWEALDASFEAGDLVGFIRAIRETRED